MKKVFTYVIIIITGSQLLISYGNENVLSQFSKRKYLNKFKPTKVKLEDNVGDVDVIKNIYATDDFRLEELEEVDESAFLEKNKEEEVITSYKVKANTLINFNKKEIFKNQEFIIDDFKEENEKSEPETLPLAIISTALLFLVIPAAFITGIIALNKINKNPEKYKGRVWAWLGIILGGLLTIIITIIIIYLTCCFTFTMGSVI